MASGGKIQTAIRQKSEDMGPVCSDRHLCAHARMVNRYAAGCKEVQVVAGFPVWLQVIGGLVLIPSLYLIFESTAENTFASTMVRVRNRAPAKSDIDWRLWSGATSHVFRSGIHHVRCAAPVRGRYGD